MNAGPLHGAKGTANETSALMRKRTDNTKLETTKSRHRRGRKYILCNAYRYKNLIIKTCLCHMSSDIPLLIGLCVSWTLICKWALFRYDWKCGRHQCHALDFAFIASTAILRIHCKMRLIELRDELSNVAPPAASKNHSHCVLKCDKHELLTIERCSIMIRWIYSISVSACLPNFRIAQKDMAAMEIWIPLGNDTMVANMCVWATRCQRLECVIWW